MRRQREETGRLRVVGDAPREENEGRKEVLSVAVARLWGARVARRILERLQRDAGEEVAPRAGETGTARSKTIAALGAADRRKVKKKPLGEYRGAHIETLAASGRSFKA